MIYQDGLLDTVDRAAEVGRGDFYRRASEQSVAPLWRVLDGLVTATPVTACRPWRWAYRQVRPYLLEACDLISTGEAQRRVLVLENPGVPGQSRITGNLFAGLQIIKPGESAPPHRHVASALRFIIEGHDAFTAIHGERTVMAPGDFVITPSWTWHDHGSDSDEVVMWLDGLDMHIVNMCEASFCENYQGEYPVTRPYGASAAEVGSNLLPVDYKAPSQTSPILNYPYAVTREALYRLTRIRDADRWCGYKMNYINPVTGGSAMPTMTTSIQLLPRGFKTQPYRCTSGTVYNVVEGRGTTRCGDWTVEWEPRDVFVIPSWHRFTIESTEDAVLFSFSDRIVQEKLDFFREQCDPS